MRRRALLAGVVAALAATTLLLGNSLSNDSAQAGPSVKQLVRAGFQEQQAARRTGEPTHYTRSERALRQALEQDPNDVRALIGLASLSNTRHHFREGLVLARRVQSLTPDTALVYGVIGDALVELGRYEAGFRAYERMVELKPSIAGYARIAHAQSLLGENDGARRTLRLALDSAVDAETRAWAYVELGRLDRTELRLAAAERQFRKALAVSPGHPIALEAFGETEAARGNLAHAIRLQAAAVERRFSPEFAASLGDLHSVAGDKAAAERAYAPSRRPGAPARRERRRHRPGQGHVPAGARDRPQRFTSSCAPRLRTAAGRRGERGALVGARPKRSLSGSDSLLEPGSPFPRRAPLLPPGDDRTMPRADGGSEAPVPQGPRDRSELLSHLGAVRAGAAAVNPGRM